MSGDPTLELIQVIKEHGTKRVLDGIDLSVHRGEVFGYVGTNGAGKTTTIRILSGLLRPTSGEARICQRSVADDPLGSKARIGYVPESGAIFEKLSAREYLGVIGRLYRLEGAHLAERLFELLRHFGLAERADERMDTFSKGMKQKICLAAALLHDPEVLLLDEPLNGLDVETVLLIKELLKKLAAEQKTIFYTSHLVDIVEKVCTRIAVLHRGRLAAVGTVPEILAATGSPSLEQALIGLWREK